MTHKDIYNFLRNTSWNLHREITNNLNPSLAGTAKGDVVFTEDKKTKTLIYEENIAFYLDNNSYNSTKKYMYRLNNNNYLEVYSEQGLMYMLDKDLSGLHQCSLDLYSAVYVFNFENNKFYITYTVSGPRKNYVSFTKYEI